MDAAKAGGHSWLRCSFGKSERTRLRKTRAGFTKPCGTAARYRVYNCPMKTLLVPVDFSAVSGEIYDTAITLARALDGQIVLLNVVQPPIITSDYALPVEALQEALLVGEKAAANRLAEQAAIIRQGGLRCETVVRQGAPVAIILEEAARANADFIIMGSHGHGKLYDFLVGSTASGVIKRAPCAVMILPPPDRRP